jgi:hypothetical protein
LPRRPPDQDGTISHPPRRTHGKAPHRRAISGLKDLEPLIDIIRLTLLTAYIKNVPKPNSVLIIAKPESGKTEVMKKFAICKNVAYLSDVTGFGIQRDFLAKIDSGEVRHLMIPDLLRPLSTKESTVNSFITTMNSLIEEVVAAISTYATPSLVSFKKHVKCGLITAITSDEFRDNRHNWKKKGFLSRTIPFSYSYGMNTINRVFESILDLDYMKEQEIRLNIPKQDVDIKLPQKYARAILPSTTMIAEAQETYGFRLQKQFQALLQASALDLGRRTVNRSDVDRVLRLMNWVNFDEKPIA